MKSFTIRIWLLHWRGIFGWSLEAFKIISGLEGRIKALRPRKVYGPGAVARPSD